MFFKVNPRKPVLPKPVPAPILTVPTGCCKQKHQKVTPEVVCISTRCRLYVRKILRYVLITLSAKTFYEIVMAMRVKRVRRLACSKWRSNRAYISYLSSFCTSRLIQSLKRRLSDQLSQKQNLRHADKGACWNLWRALHRYQLNIYYIRLSLIFHNFLRALKDMDKCRHVFHFV